ncbi:MAG: LpxD N-terminal domain-containing protein, partial [Burkholderiales bacterium]
MNGSVLTYSLRELVARFGGEVIGDPEVRVSRVATLENAGPEAIAFLANPRYLRHLATTKAAAVILSPAERDLADTARIVHEQPYLYFARVSTLLASPRQAR